jgi:hypothetical protein
VVLLNLRVFKSVVGKTLVFDKWVPDKTQHPPCLHQSRTAAAIVYTHSKIKDC